MNTCAYCGDKYKFKELTKEHTVNKSLIDFMELQKAPGYASFSDNYTINYLTTKDVCASCNNGALSRLDKYSIEFMKINNLLDLYIDENTKLDVKFDFDLLSKWLLKTIYNSERKNAYAEVEKKMYIYKKHILGEENIPFEIYLEILKDVPKEEIHKHNKSVDKLKPFLKLGNVMFNSHNGIEYLKFFAINNFMFYIFILPRKESNTKAISTQVKAFRDLYKNEGIKIFNLKKDYKYFSASRRTIIDILGDTYQGEKKFVDHADTAVKIGLGGLITGIFTFIGVRFTHKSDKEKHLLEHTTNVLEQISEDIGGYFDAWNAYISKIAGITKILASNKKNISDLQRKAIRERNDLLVDTWKKKDSAKSKSYLIKAIKVADAIDNCTGLEKELRDRIVFKNEIPTYEEVIEIRKEVKKAQKEVYVQLSEYYAELGT